MRWAILLLTYAIAFAAVSESTNLAFKPVDNGAFTFDTGVLRGTLRHDGRSVGLQPIEHIATGTQLTGNEYGLFSHYRVFTENHRYGHAAWDWPSTATLRPDGALEVRWPAAEDHPFEMGAVYRWAAPDTLDLETSVTAHADLKAFESFLASYFSEGFQASTVYAKIGAEGKPAFQTTPEEAGVWQAFPRDRSVVSIIQDGRWKWEPSPVDWAIREDLAAPLGIRRNPANGLCAILMAPPQDCFTVMTPCAGEGHRSLYLCQLGRDVKNGETATAHARIVVRALATDAEAVPLYEAFTQQAPGK